MRRWQIKGIVFQKRYSNHCQQDFLFWTVNSLELCCCCSCHLNATICYHELHTRAAPVNESVPWCSMKESSWVHLLSFLTNVCPLPQKQKILFNQRLLFVKACLGKVLSIFTLMGMMTYGWVSHKELNLPICTWMARELILWTHG